MTPKQKAKLSMKDFDISSINDGLLDTSAKSELKNYCENINYWDDVDTKSIYADSHTYYLSYLKDSFEEILNDRTNLEVRKGISKSNSFKNELKSIGFNIDLLILSTGIHKTWLFDIMSTYKYSTIQEIINGKKDFRIVTIFKVATVLNIDYQILFLNKEKVAHELTVSEDYIKTKYKTRSTFKNSNKELRSQLKSCMKYKTEDNKIKFIEQYKVVFNYVINKLTIPINCDIRKLFSTTLVFYYYETNIIGFLLGLDYAQNSKISLKSYLKP